MKNLFRIAMSFAVAAMAIVACQKDIEQPIDEEQVLVSSHISFYAEAGDPATRATLTTEDEKSFKAAWEVTDHVSLYAKSTSFEEEADATWSEENKCFEGDFSASAPQEKEAWTYKAKYPYSQSGSIPFGSARVQQGNAYNSAYDVMYGEQAYESAFLGKDEAGNAFVIPMNRLSGIAYFHITSDIDEDVLSATLEATGIAADNVSIASDGASVSAVGNTLNEITITFVEGTAPKATDLKLWFNVLPGSYPTLKLTITTATKTAVLNANNLTYTAGKLNKAVLNSLNWKSKPQEYIIEFIDKKVNQATLSTSTSAATVIEETSLPYVLSKPFTSVTKAYYGNNQQSGLPLRIGTSSDDGSVAIALSDVGKVTASSIIVNARQYSSGKTKMIGVNGSNKQQPGDSFEDLTFTVDGGDLEEIILQTDGYIVVKYIKVVYTPKKTAALSFPESSYSITEGESFAAPSLSKNPSDLPVSFTSSDESVAIVDASTGSVTVKGIGTTTITAKFAGNDEYNSAKASYTLTVSRAMATSIAQIKDDLNGSTTEMEFTVSLTNAIVTRKYSDFIAYIQDETAGVLVTDAENLTEGDSYTGTVSGTIITERNQPKITALDISKATKTTGATVPPELVTIASLKSDINTFDGKLCKLVKAKANSGLQTGTNKSVTISQGENSMTLFSRVSFEEGVVNSGDYYDIIGIPCLYNSTYEIVVVSTDDVAESEINWLLKSVGIATQPTKRSYVVGESFDPTGLVISTVYEDATDASIIKNGNNIAYAGNESYFSFSPSLSEELTTANTSVTITYNDKATTQAITVTSGERKTYTVQTIGQYCSNNVQNYTSSFTITDDDLTLTLQNFNNNNKSWDCVKAGPKNSTSTATITSSSISEPIKSVIVTISALENGSASAKLYVATNDTFTENLQTINYGALSAGDAKITIPTATQSCYYKLEFECVNTSSKKNGVISVSKVVFTTIDN